MNTCNSLLLTALLGATATAALAGDRQQQELAVCAAEVREYYGADTEVKVVSRKRGIYGTQLTVAAALDADNVRFASCWVGSDELAALDARDSGEQVVAATVKDEITTSPQ